MEEDPADTDKLQAPLSTQLRTARAGIERPAGPYLLRKTDTGLEQYALDPGGKFVIGRDPGCELCIDDEEVSREHAVIEGRDGAFTLRDRSRNGVSVNGEPVSSAHRLRPGDYVQIGDELLFYCVPSRSVSSGSVANRRFLDLLRRELRDASVGDRCLALLCLLMEGCRWPAGEFLHLFERTLGHLDVYSRAADGAFLVLLGERTHADAERRVRALGEALWVPCPDMRAGVALYPALDLDADGLVLAAREAAGRAPAGQLAFAKAPSSPALPGLGRRVVQARGHIEVYQLLRDYASSRTLTVLIRGESGTGKEDAARYVHEQSDRRKRPFVAISCAAIPEKLFESQFFGHERGAFTGASERRIGDFELADGGTLFLDEVGELTPAHQAGLLRVLEDRTSRRIGGARDISFDVRIVAATNRDLPREVAAGRFREDLWFRLRAGEVVLPPLRERACELRPLVDLFLRDACRDSSKKIDGLSRAARLAIQSYRWPGNARELRNVIDLAVARARGAEIQLEDLREDVRKAAASPEYIEAPEETDTIPEFYPAVEEFQRDLIVRALRSAGGVIKRAAELLTLDQSTLGKMIKRLGIDATAARAQ